MLDYDAENVFAKILRGEIPAAKVYENDDILAFMDAMPQSEGHTLVIPKAPSKNIFDAEASTVGMLFEQVQHIARAVQLAFNADGIHISQYNGAASGQTVFHLHVHIIPRFESIALFEHAKRDFADFSQLKEHANRIRAVLDTQFSA